MRRILYYVVGTGLVFYGWHHYRQTQLAADADPASVAAPGPGTAAAAPPDSAALAVERPVDEDRFRCDGRVYCSQMHSCEEATWFLQHCAGTKMDGDGDGIPCEDQHCGH